jgi:hypothetical protein
MVQDRPSRRLERSALSTNRTTARIAGALFITATVADLLSRLLLGPVRSSDYLSEIYANKYQLTVGALLLLIGALAAAGIAISLYRILRRYNEGLALGAVGFRTIEAMLYTVSVIGVLLLLALSQEFVKAGAPASSYFQTSGTILKALRDWAGLIGTLAFYPGALMYYFIFYKSKLVPRWLSGWGGVGATLGIVAALLVLFRVIGSMSTVQIVLNVPIGVNEMVLAVWLIVKGFSASSTPSPSAELASASK